MKPLNLKPVTTRNTWRIGIQGFGKTGKTWSALSFPNPVILDTDNNIPKYHPLVVEGKLLTVPFWDSDYLKEELSIVPKKEDQHPPTCFAVLKWLRAYGKEFNSEQTLILDSMTRVHDSFDLYHYDNPFYDNKGNKDTWKVYNYKQTWFTDLHNVIESLKCNFVSLCHETVERDEGRIIGIKPLLTGVFADKLPTRYQEWFRQRVIAAKDDKGKEIVDPETGKAKPRYIWEIKSDKITTCGGNLSGRIKEGFIDANYQSLMKSLET